MRDIEFNKVINGLIGKEFKDMFWQPTKDIFSDTNMFVIKFGANNEYSIHGFCFIRVNKDNRILLTSSDEFFSVQYEKLSIQEYGDLQSFEKTLLHENLNRVKEELSTKIIKSVTVSKTKDLKLEFDGNIDIEISIDCLCDDYEYYRIIRKENEITRHFVVKFTNGNISIVIE